MNKELSKTYRESVEASVSLAHLFYELDSEFVRAHKDELIRLLMTTTDWGIRDGVAIALGNAKVESAVPYLLELFFNPQHQKNYVISAFVLALWHMHVPVDVAKMIPVMKRSDYATLNLMYCLAEDQMPFMTKEQKQECLSVLRELSRQRLRKNNRKFVEHIAYMLEDELSSLK